MLDGIHTPVKLFKMKIESEMELNNFLNLQNVNSENDNHDESS